MYGTVLIQRNFRVFFSSKRSKASYLINYSFYLLRYAEKSVSQMSSLAICFILIRIDPIDDENWMSFLFIRVIFQTNEKAMNYIFF